MTNLQGYRWDSEKGQYVPEEDEFPDPFLEDMKRETLLREQRENIRRKAVKNAIHWLSGVRITVNEFFEIVDTARECLGYHNETKNDVTHGYVPATSELPHGNLSNPYAALIEACGLDEAMRGDAGNAGEPGTQGYGACGPGDVPKGVADLRYL